ncbi:galactose-binding like protein, partial [Aureobasidium melanogenum]
MPPPSRAHTTAAGSQQTRPNRNARARHSLDNTGFSIDSSELPSGLIVDYSIDDVVRPGNIAEFRRGQQTENLHLDDEDEDDGDVDIDPEEVDPDGAPSTSGDPLPPRGLKEISSLASWTVSTSKPGCGVAALRHPSSSLFWQSDGPQPHLLSVHFFKQVAVAHIRIYLDFENDESYTPTRMQFWAGTGLHDLIEFADMQFEQPRGWIPVDFSQVGLIEEEDNEDPDSIDWSKRPLLRCFILQVRILENHQNGKDTHLRGLQIFARDERAGENTGLMEDDADTKEGARVDRMDMPVRSKEKRKRSEGLPKLKKASFMMEPELR